LHFGIETRWLLPKAAIAALAMRLWDQARIQIQQVPTRSQGCFL
jgi:hypothetical protein